MSEHDDSAEVERLDEHLRQTFGNDPFSTYDAARAVLADLRERYVLVPREGAEEVEEWGILWPNQTVSVRDAEWAKGRLSGATADKSTRVAKRTVVSGPWRVAE